LQALRRLKKTLILVFAIILAFPNLNPNSAIAQANATAQRVYNREAGETPSKLPVPRFVSLRFNVVNGRSGPDHGYPIRWVYRQKGLPVSVIAETEEWRRIEDPDGSKVWVHKRMIESKRTVITRPLNTSGQRNTVTLYRSAAETSRVMAVMNQGVIAEIIAVSPGWRRIKSGRYIGWARANELWGS
jgi:SH3-like domain-containing protein